ncbi:MAG TPA: UDP-N-acetylmuramoyl-tripeptide--D-alanyl-D-alanine ligase [Gemmatimonadaceae bacterium]|nr:UDP-N-acetylmuramoyl-tripeptide--D-alanyl-D-alanine ligase [Gemmatimonadaceae bacterium]
MSFWNLDRIAAALGDYDGQTAPRPVVEIKSINTDSRSVGHGQVFLALTGENFDGHDYVHQAVEKGAVAVIVSNRFDTSKMNVPAFKVDDTLVALGRLGSFWRAVWGKPIVMIAGSNGKTTTKDLVRAALSLELTVHATTGNLNNRIGVPQTLLAIPREAEIAVIEAGTNLPGEVATLRAIIDPDITVVTSVGEEHLEGLGDIEGVLREEADSFDGVRVAITPSAQPEIAEAAKDRAREVVTAGLDEGDVTPSSWTITPDGRGTLVLDKVVLNLPLRGLHNLRNAMLAIAVARVCGVADENSVRGIEEMPVPRMRTAWEEIGRVTLINDAYNANPGSTRAAIDLIKGVGAERQRVIVLGTMRELGEASDKCHDDITKLALASGADLIAGVGDFANSFSRLAGNDPRVVSAPTVAELWPLLAPRMQPNAVILLKASRGVKLEQMVPHITTWANS